MPFRALLVGVVVALASACASPLSPTTIYACSARDADIAAVVATDPAYPMFAVLPSGERVYLMDAPPHTNPAHVSGPTCQ